ncbi:MAG TPA: hypothetical protein DHW65_09145 [Dehalococcoidia bacterium]|nr:hypothetical protein [Chloroflexota bacterium]HCL26494.1 hypothetical protein [Dehalococcoidia bacterium]
MPGVGAPVCYTRNQRWKRKIWGRIMAGNKVVCFTELDSDLRQMVADKTMPGMDVTSEPLGISDEADLARALSAGVIAGAGLDVLEKEQPEPGHPLTKLDNAIITSHIAGPTLEFIPKRAANAFANIKRVMDGGEPQWTATFGNTG